MGNSTPPPSIKDLVRLARWRATVADGDRGFWFLDGEDHRLLSFATLERRARAVGARLADQIEPEDRVLLLYPPSLAYVEAFFGALFAGAIAVPAYPPNPKRLERTLPRLLNIIDDSGASVVATTHNIAQMAPVLSAQAPQLAQVEWLATDTIDDDAADQWRMPELSDQSVAFLQYTSGSTGRPKGVVLDHETLLQNEELIRDAFDCSNKETSVSWLPLYHDMGLIGGVIQPIFSGMGAVLMSPLDFLKRPASWLEAISEFEATMSGGPNFAYDLAARKTPQSTLETLDLSRWRVACNGAEPVRMETMERFAARFEPCGFDKRAFMPAYGLAEVGLVVSVTPGPQVPRKVVYENGEFVSCGPLLGDFDVRIVDPDTDRALPQGQEGEIWLRRGSVACGYWNNDEVTARVFQARTKGGEGPFLRTGDLGFVVDGELVVTARLDDLIVIRGVNHYPHDIEATVEGVDEAIRPGCGAAFAFEQRGERNLVIVQEVSTEKMDDAEALIRQIREEVSVVHGVSPRDVVLIEPKTIEKTSSGKIRRFAARKNYEEDQLAVVARMEGTAKRTDAGKKTTEADVEEDKMDSLISEGGDPDRWAIESWLASRVADESGIEKKNIALDQPFSAYGIDSAEAVGMVGELEHWLGRSITATALYDYPTISALAAHLAGKDEEVTAAVASPRRNADGTQRPEGQIAIVGMACRFPGADDLEAFYKLIESGRQAITNVAEKRWETGFDTEGYGRAGIIDGIETFDAPFFGISPREAQAMDPQQRMILETGWHAIEDAGWTRKELRGSRTAVFIGQSGNDFARLYQGPPVRAGSGMSSSITANRLSYWLDLRGSSMVVDTACSSSLVALDRALMELRSGRCDAAIVGGVNALLAPEVSEAFARAQMLSPTGQCRSFDAEADGYVRGEGCGVVVLRRLEDALEKNDRIRAVISGCAVNQDGRTNGLLAPDGGAQKEVVEGALVDAGIPPKTIGAIEAQGTATPMGDAIEARALRSVFDGPDNKAHRTWLGSIKAQIGHLEAASGMAGLIKAALMVENGVVGPQANFETPNPSCELEESSLCIPRSVESWPGSGDGGQTPRRAGISAFGFGGTNAHVVIEEPPTVDEDTDEEQMSTGIVCLSAANADRLQRYAEALVEDAAMWSELTSVRDLGFSLGAQRDVEPLRWTMVTDDVDDVRRALTALAGGQKTTNGAEEASLRRRPRVGLVFSNGDGWDDVVIQRLIRHLPPFEAQLRNVCRAIEDAKGPAVSKVFFGNATGMEPWAAFCAELAMARLWSDWGLQWEVALGWGIGELAAACAIEEPHWKEAVQRLGNKRFDDDADGAEMVREISGKNLDVVVEVDPGATLTTMAQKLDAPSTTEWITAADMSQDGVAVVLEVAARLWKRFGAVDPKALNAGAKRIRLAKTPFVGEHYWPDPDELRRPGGGR